MVGTWIFRTAHAGGLHRPREYGYEAPHCEHATKTGKQPSRVHIQVCSELCVGLPLNLIAALARVVVLFAEQARDLRNGREGAGYRVFKTAPKLPICPSN